MGGGGKGYRNRENDQVNIGIVYVQFHFLFSFIDGFLGFVFLNMCTPSLKKNNLCICA